MTWKYIMILCFCGALISCSGGGDEPEVVSLEEFLGETGQIEEEVNEIKDSIILQPTGIVGQFVYNQLTEFDTSYSNEFHPIDRFTFNQRNKILFKSKTDVPYGDETLVTPRAEFFYYTFSDTAKTKNAFYNWLDSFSEDGIVVKLNEPMEYLKTPPRFALIYDTVIVAVNYRCEDKKHNWRPFQDSIMSRFGDNYNYRMEIGCGGPLKWK